MAHRPADDVAAEGIEHDRHIEEAGPGRDTSDVGDPQLVSGAVGIEVPIDKIAGRANPLVPEGRAGTLCGG